MVAAHKLAQRVHVAGRSGLNWLILQEAPHIFGESTGRRIAAAAILFEALHDDPVEVALKLMYELARLRPPALSRRGAGIA